MHRCVEPELLDALQPEDPCAVDSRHDLVKVNASMGNARILARVLSSADASLPRRIIELGAGDGRFALSVARRLATRSKDFKLILVDRTNAFHAETREAFKRLDVRVEFAVADVFNWLREYSTEPSDAMVANLFLHHFSATQLTELFREAAKHARVFIAVEPRRSPLCLRFSRLLWFLGCNHVTRHDAPVSVRAGFVGHDLSQLWPDHSGWLIEESPAGLFSHLFVARRKD